MIHMSKVCTMVYAQNFSLLAFLAVLSHLVTCEGQLVGTSDSRGDRIWKNHGSLGRYEIMVFEALRPNAALFLLGQRAQNNWNSLEEPVHYWRDESSMKDSFSKPTGFTFIWNTERGDYYETASLWRVVCPSGYVTLSDFFHKAIYVKEPPEELFDKVRCVKADLTEDCSWGVKIWDNEGAFARLDGAVWGVDHKETSFNTGHFYGNNQHNVRPDITPKCLKKSAVLKIESL